VTAQKREKSRLTYSTHIKTKVGRDRHTWVLEIKMLPAWGCRHWVCATFLQTECASSAGRVVAEVRTGQNTKKKWHSLREVRTVGERGLCCRRPVVVLDGFRQVGHHEILLNAMLKIEQR